MANSNLLSTILEKFAINNLSPFIVELISALILLAIGIFLGRIVKFILKKIIDKAEIRKMSFKSFINLFLVVIEFSIYILFLSFALKQLNIPQLTDWLTFVLIIIPALVGALLLIVVGFVIAVYLRDIIEESEILHAKILSMIFFYFINYIFVIFALKTALISLDKNTVNMVIIILTAVVSVAIAFWHVKKH